MKLKKGDQIIVISGKDKGRRGRIEKIFPKTGKALIPGINIVKKHIKPRKEGEKGGIVEISKPIDISKIALICPKCGKSTRVGYLIINKNKGNFQKERICKKCQAII